MRRRKEGRSGEIKEGLGKEGDEEELSKNMSKEVASTMGGKPSKLQRICVELCCSVPGMMNSGEEELK